MCHIFLESLGKIEFNEDDPGHHDHHQEGQDNQECPPSTGRFFMTIFITYHMYPIFSETLGKIKFN